MAQLPKSRLKPPMLVLEYIEKESGDIPSALNKLQFSLGDFASVEARVEKNTFKDVKLGLFNSLNLGLSPDKGKYGIDSLSFTPSQNIKKVTSLKTNDVNKGDMDFANANGTSLANIIKFVNPVAGWAIARNKKWGNQAADINETHIVLLYEPARASLGETAGVITVKETTGGPVVVPKPGSAEYYDNKIVKFPARLNGKPNKAKDPTTSIGYKLGDNKYKIVILNDDPPVNYGDGLRYVYVSYYKGATVTPDKNKLTIDPPIQTDNNTLTSDIESIYLAKNPKEIGSDKIITDNTYTINFYDLTTKNFGFGVERFDFSGDSRKTVQQTRGTYSLDEDDAQGNFYVDTWGKGPENITLVGAMELPYGYDEKLIDIAGDAYSFYDAMEKFFSWNNNPQRINRGDYMILRDLYNKQNYIVTFKSRKWPQSVERQSILPFEFNFIVIGRTK